MSKTSNILSKLLVFFLILFTFLFTVNFWCFNISFYNKQHNKIKLYDQSISEYIGIDDKQLEDLTIFVLDYLNDKNDSLDLEMNIKGEDREVFTQDEKDHMVDVKKLNLNARYVMIISFIIVILISIYFIKKHILISNIFIAYKKGLIYFLLFFSLLAFWILIDFDSFWTFFHKIFFAGNELWLLNLKKDILIMIVPPEFFNNLVIRILITFLGLLFIIFISLYLINNRKKTYD